MKTIKTIIVGALLLGGLIIMAASCEAFSFLGMAAGLAMLTVGALLSNRWESEVCG